MCERPGVTWSYVWSSHQKHHVPTEEQQTEVDCLRSSYQEVSKKCPRSVARCSDLGRRKSDKVSASRLSHPDMVAPAPSAAHRHAQIMARPRNLHQTVKAYACIALMPSTEPCLKRTPVGHCSEGTERRAITDHEVLASSSSPITRAEVHKISLPPVNLFSRHGD